MSVRSIASGIIALQRSKEGYRPTSRQKQTDRSARDAASLGRMSAINGHRCDAGRRVMGLSLSFASALFVLSACASSSKVADGSASAACLQRQKSAEGEVQRSLDANATCSVDADCAVVEVVTECFDECTRPVNAGGVSSVKRAIDAVNAGDCATYARDCGGVVHPPCVARVTGPLCTNGRCQ